MPRLKPGDEVGYIGPIQSMYGKKNYVVKSVVIRPEDNAEIASVIDMKTGQLGPSNRGLDYSKKIINKII